jgi:membrane associated rhomboid family serine protease
VIPLRDRNPTHRIPVVNITLILVNLAAFVYQLSLGDRLGEFFLQYGVVPRTVLDSFSTSSVLEGAIVPMVASMFLHGGFLHLGGNMLYLWVFGDNVEDKLGHARFAVFYILCGFAATTIHVVIDPMSTVPTIGASGAISGVLAAYLVMFPGARVVTLIPILVFLHVAEFPALVVLGFWFVMQFFNGLLSLGHDTAGMGGVAWWAHIGGFLAGLLFVVPFRKFR